MPRFYSLVFKNVQNGAFEFHMQKTFCFVFNSGFNVFNEFNLQIKYIAYCLFQTVCLTPTKNHTIREDKLAVGV